MGLLLKINNKYIIQRPYIRALKFGVFQRVRLFPLACGGVSDKDKINS